MELEMNGPVVLITGALTGIGRATAVAFAREGHRVVVSGRRDEAGNALAAELRELGAQAEYMHADVTNEAEIRQVVEQTIARFGRLDIAVNNAGTEGENQPLVELTIVNLSSIAGHAGFASASVYAGSKHAIEGITKSAALEGAAAGVRVNAVAPGPVATQMLDRFTGSDDAKADFVASMPARRAGQPDEIAQTIVFLGSDKARYLTGQIVSVDGGFSAQ
jgi:NAD(P)-dependent dehydrogenase (short-subunit alcohol dehydrogenase family)